MKRLYIYLALGLCMCVNPPAILKAAAPIRIGDVRGSGLAISDPKLHIDLQAISNASYTITNNSGKTLLACVSSVSLYWDTAPEAPVKQVYAADGWFLNGGLLGPGEHDNADLNVSFSPHEPMRLLRAEFNLDYAEFSDGSTWGTLAKKDIDKLNALRQDKLDVERHYMSLLAGGLAPAGLAARIDSDLQLKKTFGSHRTALIQLQIALKSMGPDALAEKIRNSPASIPAGVQ